LGFAERPCPSQAHNDEQHFLFKGSTSDQEIPYHQEKGTPPAQKGNDKTDGNLTCQEEGSNSSDLPSFSLLSKNGLTLKLRKRPFKTKKMLMID